MPSEGELAAAALALKAAGTMLATPRPTSAKPTTAVETKTGPVASATPANIRAAPKRMVRVRPMARTTLSPRTRAVIIIKA